MIRKTLWRMVTALIILSMTVPFVQATPLTQPPQPPDSPPDPIQRLMDATDGTARVSTSKATGVAQFVSLEPASLSFDMATSGDEAAIEQAMSFLKTHGDVFGTQDPQSELKVTSVKADFAGARHVSYQQFYGDVPVFAGVLRVHFNKQGQLTAANGTFIPNLELNTTPSLSAETAAAIAVAKVTGEDGAAFQFVRQDVKETAVSDDITARNVTLYVYRTNLAQGGPGLNHLVYEVEVGDGFHVREFVYVDAHKGYVVDQVTGIYTDLQRQTYDAHSGPAAGIQVTLCRDEGDGPSGIVACDEAHDYAGDTYNYFWYGFGRDSLDDAGLPLTSYYDVCPSPDNCPWQNASWNGQFMSYGNRLNGRSITGDDTVGHELTHGLTDYTSNLIYAWQPGAINEAMSDIFGEAIDQLNSAGVDNGVVYSSTLIPDVPRVDYPIDSLANYPDSPCLAPYGWDDHNVLSYTQGVQWLQGEQDWLIRDMWAPSCMGDPDHVTHPLYHCAASDGGGVHTNSGVVNHHFALLTDGGTFNGQVVTGTGIIKSGAMYYQAQVNYLTPASGFADLADALNQSCTDLLGVNLPDPTDGTPSGEIITAVDCAAVSAASLAVELYVDPTTLCGGEPMLEQPAPPLCSPLEEPVDILLEDWEAGDLSDWAIGRRDVLNPGEFITLDWLVTDTLPSGNTGYAAFAEDPLTKGSCDAPDDQSSVRYLESPTITVPSVAATPLLAFDHWVATEPDYDGGNVKISVNGGSWQLVPDSAFTFNGYVGPLASAGAGNTNPLAGEGAFHGTNAGSVAGSWGQSQVDLSGFAGPGDEVKLRFELGIDGCNGNTGWYVDQVDVYYCNALPTGMLQGTVTEAGTGDPVAGALVEAQTNPTFYDTTDASGAYAMTVITGTYTITASAFAYTSTTTSGVLVTEDSTVVQDFTLDPMETYVVDGTVTDANTGWPLYAWVGVSGGYPGGGVWSNPVTGFYSVALPSGVTHTLSVEAWVDGYLPATRDVNLTSDGTEDFALDVDEIVCIAPGYRQESGVFQPFETGGLPTGWSVVDNVGNGQTWSFNNPGARANLTGGDGLFAIVDSDYYGGGGYQDTELRTPVMDLSSLSVVTLEFKYDYYTYSGYDIAAVDVSTNSATGPWTEVFSRTLANDRGPATAQIDISAIAAGQSNVMVRFHYYDAFYEWWWQVDDVLIGEPVCVAPTGGLVVGNVYDANTGDPVIGAGVSNDSGESAATVALADPNVDGGFYTLFSPTGAHVFTATMAEYSDDVETPTVLAGDTVRQDFTLQAGLLSYTPEALEITLPCDVTSATLPLTLTNEGALPVMFSFDVPGTLLSAGFDDGMMPPSGWQTATFSASSRKWTLVDAVTYPDFVHSGDYAAWVNYDSVDSQDEWLFSPPIDLTDTASPQLAFWALSDTNYPGATMSLYAIEASGAFTDTLWDMIADETWTTWEYRQVTQDLSAYSGETIRLAWRYHGLDGDSFGLDDIVVSAVSALPWLSVSPLDGTVPAAADQVVDVIFDASELAPGQYTTELLFGHDTPYEVPDLPVTLTVELVPTWDKTVYINGELVEIFPAVAVPSDTVEIVDEVSVPCSGDITFSLTEEWTESFELMDYNVYALPGGTVIVPGFGTVIPAPGMLVVSVTNSPGDWEYVITKTFTVLDVGSETDVITETLVVEDTYPPLDPIVLQFVSERSIYLPLIMRNW